MLLVEVVWLLVLVVARASTTRVSSNSSTAFNPVSYTNHVNLANSAIPADPMFIASLPSGTESGRIDSSKLIAAAVIRHLEVLGDLAQRACHSLSQECDRRSNSIRVLEVAVEQVHKTNLELQTLNDQLKGTTRQQEATIQRLHSDNEHLQNINQHREGTAQQRDNTYTESPRIDHHTSNYHLQSTIEELRRTEQQLRERLQNKEDENQLLQQKLNELKSERLWRINHIRQMQERMDVGELSRRRHGSGGETDSWTHSQHGQDLGFQPLKTPWDCTEASQRETVNDVYTIFPRGGGGGGVRVSCRRVGGRAWTVILARSNHSVPKVDFAKPWSHYKYGFGDPTGEYWIGNDHLHDLTAGLVNYSLRVEATNLKGETRSGEWQSLRVGDEASRYELTLNQYLPGSDLGNALTYLEKTSFTTYDRDYDTYPRGNCAVRHGGGWWYHGCGLAFPTAPFGHTNDNSRVLSWAYFGPNDRGWVGLSHLKMMIAPVA